MGEEITTQVDERVNFDLDFIEYDRSARATEGKGRYYFYPLFIIGHPRRVAFKRWWFIWMLTVQWGVKWDVLMFRAEAAKLWHILYIYYYTHLEVLVE